MLETEQPGWSKARVIEKRTWAPGLVTLRLEAETEPFEAGQFFNLGLYVDGVFERRAYSAASAPGQALEFFIAEVQEGQFSPRLFALEQGDSIWVEKKPQGFFTLRYVPAAGVLWLIATGTGLGPFLSMLRGGEPWRRFERVVLVHGVRDASQLAYQDELRAWREDRSLQHVTCFSRDRDTPGGLPGRITEALLDGSLERSVGIALSPDTAHVMLCGNPAMIADVTEILKGRGLAKHRVRKPGHITTEKYW